MKVGSSIRGYLLNLLSLTWRTIVDQINSKLVEISVAAHACVRVWVKTLPFDPAKDIHLLSDEEITSKGFTDEYLRFNNLRYILCPWIRGDYLISHLNTLGHVSGSSLCCYVHSEAACDAGLMISVYYLPRSFTMVIHAARKKSAVCQNFTLLLSTITAWLDLGYRPSCIIAANHLTWGPRAR